jgi:putative FmdB family regulatory protein
MPTYEYECQGCAHTFEVFQNINEPRKKKCPECKKLKLKRLFGVPSIKFIGSGFYVNDYPKEPKVKED